MSKIKKKRTLKKKRVRKAALREKRSRINKRLTGVINITPNGYGFVKPDEEGGDIFIPPRYIGDAMDGDHVEVGILAEQRNMHEPGHGLAGRVMEVITRKHTKVVGELLAGHKVRPLNKRLKDNIKLSGSLCGAKRGDWVELDLLNNGDMHDGERRGTVTGSFGKAGEIESDLQAIIKEYNLPSPYSEEDDKKASTLTEAQIDRKDLTNLFCVTIDPVDAKDFDDAVSLSPAENDNEVLVGVHIADVATWILRDSKWDKAARKRSFTAYLPCKTMPMLPKSLTKKISLTADSESLAHSVMMSVDKRTGEVKSSKRFHSKIKVDKRLNFDEVQDFIDSKQPQEGWSEAFADKMQQIVDITVKMRKFRKSTEKFLELATVDIRVVCDEENKKVIGLERKIQKDSDKLIEDCMLAANTEVAKELIQNSIPGIYRIHPDPDPEKLEEFSVFISKTFGFNPGDLSSRTACNHFLGNLEDDHKKPVIISAFLRSLPRASYIEEHALHFGLGKERYSHFTSPIRRYPDLVVHQQLWASDTKSELRSKKVMEEYSSECTKKEANNDEAYYAANDRLKLHYLEQLTGDSSSPVYEGAVSKVSSAGFTVDIAQLGIYGFVPIELLTGHFLYSKAERTLTSTTGDKHYKCGDYIYLRLDRIDFIRGSALFRPVTQHVEA